MRSLFDFLLFFFICAKNTFQTPWCFCRLFGSSLLNPHHSLITFHLQEDEDVKCEHSTRTNFQAALIAPHVNDCPCWSRYIHVVHQMANEAQLRGHDEGSGACPLLKWHLMGRGAVRTLGCHCTSPQWGHQWGGNWGCQWVRSAAHNGESCTWTELSTVLSGKS